MTSERPLPHAALSAHAHNRIGLRRTDDAWLDERMADPATRVLVVAGNRLRLVDGAVEWVTPGPSPPTARRVLLGERDDVVHLAVIVAPDDGTRRPRGVGAAAGRAGGAGRARRPTRPRC